MAATRYNRTCRPALAAITLAFVAQGCGRPNARAGDKSPSEVYEIPDGVRSPDLLSPVPIGSLRVATFPPSGHVQGTVLLRLGSEPGTKVFYSFFKIDDATPDTDLTEYSAPLLLLPPAALWAVAIKDGARGPISAMSFTPDPEVFLPLNTEGANRLRNPMRFPTPLPLSTESVLVPAPTEAIAATAPIVDGAASDWSMQGRLAGLDALFDVPSGFSMIDLSWAEVRETETHLFIALAPRSKPEAGFVYGADVGPSNIGLESFGKGADYRWRVEAWREGKGGKIRLVRRSDGAELPLAASASAAFGDIVEISVPKESLEGFAPLGNVGVRAFAQASEDGATIFDRIEPVFLRSSFALRRAAANADGKRTFQLDFLYDAFAGVDSVANEYLAMSQAMIPEIEAINGIPFYNPGSLPIFFVAKEENGYSGLNTTDRGLLTTVGPGSSALAKAQLLAHELAHFQNARHSQLKPRWLQEGMSEWTAERLLYRRFPARAVYRFMRNLRFDRYFDSLQGKPDLFPLAKWEGEAQTLGYEKSLMLLALLDHLVGTAALEDAFQSAVNEPMDTPEFIRRLTRETGKDVALAVESYVSREEPLPEFDPYALFKDEDGDELLTLDEMNLGTDPKRPDTDGDGLPDGEEAFANGKPLKSFLDPEGALSDGVPQLAVVEEADTSAPLRLGGAKKADFFFSLNPYGASAATAYEAPVILRPPFAVLVDGKLGTSVAGARVLSRDLYAKGVKVTPTFAPDHLTPPTARGATSIPTGLTYGDGVGDGEGQIPATDHASDLPREISAYDNVGLGVVVTEDGVEVSIASAGSPEPHGDWGDVILAFDGLTWSTNGPATQRLGALTLARGAPYWHSFDGAVEASAPLAKGISLSYGTSLRIRLSNDVLAAWRAHQGEQQVCVASQIDLGGESRFRERGACITLGSDGFTERAATGPDFFGLGAHTAQLFVKDQDGNALDQAKSRRWLDLMHAAVRGFEKVLARPLLDRSQWPMHLTLKAGGPTSGSASARGGAFLNADSNLATSTIDYLLVEQLARLHMADLLERSGERPYWVQEIYIQWLTSSALSTFVKTEDVHSFHADRIDGLSCYYDGGCGNFFSADVPLGEWNLATFSSTGSVKALLMALELDALLGADGLARALTHYTNFVPDTEGLRAMLKGASPVHTAAIDLMFTTWVFGSGSAASDRAAIRATIRDQDGDDLYKFEEDKFGFSDSAANAYFP